MNDQVPVSPAQVKKNRLLLLLLLATFVVPFVVGDLAYKLGWYQGGKTNNGQLIDPPAAFAGFKARGQDGTAVTADFVKANWWLLYVMPEQCGQACRNRLLAGLESLPGVTVARPPGGMYAFFRIECQNCRG